MLVEIERPWIILEKLSTLFALCMWFLFLNCLKVSKNWCVVLPGGQALVLCERLIRTAVLSQLFRCTIICTLNFSTSLGIISLFYAYYVENGALSESGASFWQLVEPKTCVEPRRVCGIPLCVNTNCCNLSLVDRNSLVCRHIIVTALAHHSLQHVLHVWLSPLLMRDFKKMFQGIVSVTIAWLHILIGNFSAALKETGSIKIGCRFFFNRFLRCKGHAL